MALGSDALERLTMQATSSEGPVPQLLPQAVRLCLRCKPASSTGVTPIMVRPLVSKLNVATMGSPVGRAPSIAASVSSMDDMVYPDHISAAPRQCRGLLGKGVPRS